MKTQHTSWLPAAPCDLEGILSESMQFLRGLDGLCEIHGEIVLVCAFAQMSDQLARVGVEEDQRVAIARLGKDREYERAVDLFETLVFPVPG
jgi:hypothetical protein